MPWRSAAVHIWTNLIRVGFWGQTFTSLLSRITRALLAGRSENRAAFIFGRKVQASKPSLGHLVDVIDDDVEGRHVVAVLLGTGQK